MRMVTGSGETFSNGKKNKGWREGKEGRGMKTIERKIGESFFKWESDQEMEGTGRKGWSKEQKKN